MNKIFKDKLNILFFLGIFISFSFYVLISSVMNGLEAMHIENEKANKNSTINTNHYLDILLSKKDFKLTLKSKNYEIENKTNYLNNEMFYFDDVSYGDLLLISNIDKTPKLIKGIGVDNESIKTKLDNYEIMVSEKIAKDLKLTIGDKIKFFSLTPYYTLIGKTFRNRFFEIKEINTNLNDYYSSNMNLIVFNKETLQKMLINDSEYYRIFIPSDLKNNDLFSSEINTNNEFIKKLKLTPISKGNITNNQKNENENIFMVNDIENQDQEQKTSDIVKWTEFNSDNNVKMFLKAVKSEKYIMNMLSIFICLIIILNLSNLIEILLTKNKKNIEILNILGFSKKNIINFLIKKYIALILTNYVLAISFCYFLLKTDVLPYPYEINHLNITLIGIVLIFISFLILKRKEKYFKF